MKTHILLIENRNKAANFTPTVKKIALLQANGRCSNPYCRQPTIQTKYIIPNRGEAAHITAASPNGPRFDNTKTDEERRSINNCIHLCHSCHHTVDKFSTLYPIDTLQFWKHSPNSNLTVSRTKLFPKGGRCNRVAPMPLNFLLFALLFTFILRPGDAMTNDSSGSSDLGPTLCTSDPELLLLPIFYSLSRFVRHQPQVVSRCEPRLATSQVTEPTIGP